VRTLAFAPLLLGLVALAAGLLFHSELLRTIGFVLVERTPPGQPSASTMRSTPFCRIVASIRPRRMVTSSWFLGSHRHGYWTRCGIARIPRPAVSSARAAYSSTYQWPNVC